MDREIAAESAERRGKGSAEMGIIFGVEFGRWKEGVAGLRSFSGVAKLGLTVEN